MRTFDAEYKELKIGDEVIYGGSGTAPWLTRQTITNIANDRIYMTNKRSTKIDLNKDNIYFSPHIIKI